MDQPREAHRMMVTVSNAQLLLLPSKIQLVLQVIVHEKFIYVSIFLISLIYSDASMRMWFRAQIVGWPPVRSYRKNGLQQKKGEAETTSRIYVKVSMDGAPYLRKIDLSVYKGYQQLLTALEGMFKLTIGTYMFQTYIIWWNIYTSLSNAKNVRSGVC